MEKANILYKLDFFEGIIKKYNNNNGELISEDEYSNLLKIKTKKKQNNEQNNGSDYIEFYEEYVDGKIIRMGKEISFGGTLFYEGEYLNKERHGKGKEYYYNSKIKTEGIYKNNNLWEGKVYDNKGNLILELKKGNGLMKEYFANSKLSFEGEYLDGKRYG